MIAGANALIESSVRWSTLGAGAFGAACATAGIASEVAAATLIAATATRRTVLLDGRFMRWERRLWSTGKRTVSGPIGRRCAPVGVAHSAVSDSDAGMASRVILCTPRWRALSREPNAGLCDSCDY
ncbi:hypothetical protein GCM10022238_08510 [Gordonia hankookensis]